MTALPLTSGRRRLPRPARRRQCGRRASPGETHGGRCPREPATRKGRRGRQAGQPDLRQHLGRRVHRRSRLSDYLVQPGGRTDHRLHDPRGHRQALLRNLPDGGVPQALRVARHAGRERPVENARVTIITQEGCEVPISVSTTILRDEHGAAIGAVEFFRDLTEVEHLRQRLERDRSVSEIVSNSPRMRRIIEMLPNIAGSDCNVLVQGPSGSGKELFAEAIHRLSSRRCGPYIRINCAALPATLLESELFGACPRGVHRCETRQTWTVLPRRGRDAAARRDQRDGRRAAGQAPARAEQR